MRTKRPGEASVQYGDLRGEAAADIADDIAGLNEAARQLGFTLKGTVGGIGMYGSPVLDGDVFVTVQVFEGGSWREIKAAADASGGTLKVIEYSRDVPLVEFMKCFKRLNVSLFTRDTGVAKLETVDVLFPESVAPGTQVWLTAFF